MSLNKFAKNELLGGMVYINLDKRTDRREEFESEIVKIGLENIRRFPGIIKSHGFIGCGYAHAEVVNQSRGLKNVLIFEDDFTFLVEPEEFWNALEDAMKEPYDVIMFGCNLMESEPYPANPKLVRVLKGSTGSAYLINGHMIDKIADLLQDAAIKLEQTHQHWLYQNDAAWFPLQKEGLWLTFAKRIGKQRASYSDNSEMFMDRGYC
jgi:hypothetical protein